MRAQELPTKKGHLTLWNNCTMQYFI